jgi:hypothetical protein
MRLWIAVACVGLVACRPPGYGKGDDAPDVDAATTNRDAAIDAPVDAPASLCDRAFRLEGHAGAATVWLTGDFIAWGGDPGHGAIEFAKGGDGAWAGSRIFSAGTYLYKFIVDGTSWIADPANPDMVDDGFGGKNSRYICTP